jgi:hypothetical protein
VLAIGPRHALKVTDARDATVRWCHSWIRWHPNIHWPRIRKAIRTPRHTVFWMERLWPLIPRSLKPNKGHGIRLAQANGATEWLIQRERLEPAALKALLAYEPDPKAKWPHCPPRLREPLVTYHQAAGVAGFSWDGKPEAFMWRPGGVLVLADPFSPPPRRRR